jgi:chloride channel protein, CIC family
MATPITQEEISMKPLWLAFCAVLVGVIGGFGAIVFRMMIGFVHNLLFQASLSTNFSAEHHIAPSIWGIGIIFVPVVGAVVVTWLTQTFAPEAKGHGVPEVMNAIYYGKGKIRPVVALVKALASAISIGSGGSIGREGPIVQVGSAFGSSLGQLFTMSVSQRNLMIAAGAAAGIAATFNAPIGGLAFAFELLMVSISASTVGMVAIATVTATYIANVFIGLAPSFDVPKITLALHHIYSLPMLLWFVPFGIIMGLVSALFIRSIYWTEDTFDRVFHNPYIRHMFGMFLLGVLMYALLRLTGEYYVAGVGYSTIIELLRGILTNPWFLLILFIVKLLATCLTLGSGASGGIFSPSLFLGATFGASFAAFLNHFAPGLHADPVMFTVAGMAAMVSGTTGAVITAITMTFEQTRDYSAILPIMLSVALAYMIRVMVCKESIYTLKLKRRGFALPQGLLAAYNPSQIATDFMSTDFEIIEKEDVSAWLEDLDPLNAKKYTLVEENGEVIGVIRKELRYLMADVAPAKAINTNIIFVRPDSRWPVVIRYMQRKNSEIALVNYRKGLEKTSSVVGVISPIEILDATSKTSEL